MKANRLQLNDFLKSLFRETAQQLKGSERRQFMAKVVKELGCGGQTVAEKELGWNRGTIRKGLRSVITTVGGKNRLTTLAADHDFQPSATLTPVGIFLPQYHELYLFFVTSKVTADCLVDVLEQWWQEVKSRFPQIKNWVINADNGPENHSRRTQFMSRLVNWVHREQIPIQLAYYPPYHSKYNSVERTFGRLEQHWNGSLLDSIDTVLNFARSFKFKGKHPVLKLVTQLYETGIKLTPKAMTELEKQFQRLPGLDKWFVEIPVTRV